MLSDWLFTLPFIFGGCCSNALTLEQLTTLYPRAGSLVTFFQFLVISFQGLPNHLRITTKYWIPLPYLKPRQIPLPQYFVQVVLFYLLSLLNNVAFSYNVPMSVHIIFRSGGLAINMVLGRLILRRKYTLEKITSIIMVTCGVILTTLSASKSDSVHAAESARQYMTGITLLTVALILSGLLGIVQDCTYSKYRKQGANPWQESMFYLHFLSLPIFISVKNDIQLQLTAFRQGPSLALDYLPSFPLPMSFVLLAFNVLTQLFCVAGVNRLTTRVSSLTVTLVLVVRKAISLIISLMLFGYGGMNRSQKILLWGGASLVFVGTVVYSVPQPRLDSKEKNQ